MPGFGLTRNGSVLRHSVHFGTISQQRAAREIGAVECCYARPHYSRLLPAGSRSVGSCRTAFSRESRGTGYCLSGQEHVILSPGLPLRGPQPSRKCRLTLAMPKAIDPREVLYEVHGLDSDERFEPAFPFAQSGKAQLHPQVAISSLHQGHRFRNPNDAKSVMPPALPCTTYLISSGSRRVEGAPIRMPLSTGRFRFVTHNWLHKEGAGILRWR